MCNNFSVWIIVWYTLNRKPCGADRCFRYANRKSFQVKKWFLLLEMFEMILRCMASWKLRASEIFGSHNSQFDFISPKLDIKATSCWFASTGGKHYIFHTLRRAFHNEKSWFGGKARTENSFDPNKRWLAMTSI